MKIMNLALVALLATVLAGCETAPIKGIKEGFTGLFKGGGVKGEQTLQSGIGQYENGNYAEASRLLQASLDQGLSQANQVRAHKYLAFTHCVSGSDARCRDEFRAALKIDPSFELAANEAGHPIWGPVFRSVKGRR
jgi:Tfp pilus assembly protein PilF